MLAIIPVRHGIAPAGADETIAECGGRALFVGSGPRLDTATLVGSLGVTVSEGRWLELGEFDARRWAVAIAPFVATVDVVVLPASPDGRDLAPRLAAVLERPLRAGAIRIGATRLEIARNGGRDLAMFAITEPVVATLQPGVRGVEPADPSIRHADLEPVGAPAAHGPDTRDVNTGDATAADRGSVATVTVLEPDLSTMDLSEAPRIVGGGAGLDGADRFAQLARLAEGLGAALGATRVITDRGWVDHERQIGTTGVMVHPHLYISFGVSGAVQHTSGLGHPDHIISVNTDASCPMMQLSDLAIVSDANAVLDELEQLLGHCATTTDVAVR